MNNKIHNLKIFIVSLTGILSLTSFNSDEFRKGKVHNHENSDDYNKTTELVNI
ncbi:hypothetical protein [Pseudomonas shirazensis]